jgi:DNA-binding MarR family transcriptional regulator
MSETLKKASRKLRGIPEARLMVPEDVDIIEVPKNWLNQKNVAVRVRWNSKNIDESLPTCDFCGRIMSAKEVKTRIARSKISTRAVSVQRLGEYKEKKAKLYDLIRRGKIGCAEAFRRENEMDATYTQGRMTGSTEAYIRIECPDCNRKLGSLHVQLSALPIASPERPTMEEYVGLKKEPSILRYLHDTFKIPYGTSLEDWIKGKDEQEQLKKLKASYEELKSVPRMRHASLGIFKDMKALEEEVRLRLSKVFAELKEPGLSVVTDQFVMQVAKLDDEGLEVAEIAEKLGATQTIVERIVKHRLESREILEKARSGEYRRLRQERIRAEERKWR